MPRARDFILVRLALCRAKVVPIAVRSVRLSETFSCMRWKGENHVRAVADGQVSIDHNARGFEHVHLLHERARGQPRRRCR